jgi:hypothetical protein
MKHTNILNAGAFNEIVTVSFIYFVLTFFLSSHFLLVCMFYSLVGSLNKIPISIAGIIVFNVPLSISNLFSILFGNLSEPLNISFSSYLFLSIFIYLIFIMLTIFRSLCWYIICKSQNVLNQKQSYS